MAYTHTQYQVNMTASGLTMATSGVVGSKWTPGLVPHIIRAFSITNTSTLVAAEALVASLERISHSTATTGNVIATIKGRASLLPGSVIYKSGLNATVAPGEELQFHITTGATAAVLGQVTLWVEPKWEEPANNSRMFATAT
jgi:uncharacterized protein (DUF342 family)